MNNKGFNWFFPIAIIALLFFFVPNFMGNDASKSVSEDEFFELMQSGKVQSIVVYKDIEKAEAFLTQAAKAAEVKKAKESNPLSALNMKPKADLSFNYGDGKLFLEKFEQIKKSNPKITTVKNIEVSKNAMTELLFTALFWIGIMALFYFVIFRKMAGSGGPGGQIFSIGKSRAKLFDEKDKLQITFKDVAGLEGAKEEV